ncbi:MAG TPA: class I SAM-dependent methyltransferase [Methylomusa anaerophila]|uniref:Tellurite resistance protein TehB n=1 Tax=Methylomusa anaerophila TaxID=1930071 RepID=A0A348AF24_9FIRM|nr:class I SAM-dependent methyltransferase [Methylomusa anaerophila]BBB89672.1 tellurite resistance protein TehB [Methylomusa anaerophila]HML89551.1 class I SAM-dependent methyltransferase [Methylomusa anaerophila]
MVKMNDQVKHWNELYQSLGDKKPAYDLWLEKYTDILRDSRDMPIIDLGCGFGNDTLYLYERGYQVISCDFSPEALKRLEYFINKPVTKLFDMKEGLPFADETAKIIIADLSLHYFSWMETQKIVTEIRRVLLNGGFLLARVNSVKDINHGVGLGTVIEENYYNVNGSFKRFFDRVQLDELFSAWEVKYIKEYEICRYKKDKILWEIAVKKQE